MTVPVVTLHGFGGHASSWNAVREALPHARVEALTLFGHDPAAQPARPVAFEDEVTRITEAIRAIGEPVRLCGYSMGGRLALGVLARGHARVASAVIVGAHPGLTEDAEREARIAADHRWVELLEREGVAGFTEQWQAQPLFATQRLLPGERLAAQRVVRLAHAPAALALAMSSLGLGRMPSYWDALPRLAVPVDLVVGALDEKFTALALRMNGQLAQGRVLSVRDAGHNVLLERPDLLAEVIAAERTRALPPELTEIGGDPHPPGAREPSQARDRSAK